MERPRGPGPGSCNSGFLSSRLSDFLELSDCSAYPGNKGYRDHEDLEGTPVSWKGFSIPISFVEKRKTHLNSVKWRALGPSVLEPLVYLPLASGAQPGSSWPTSRLTGSWWFCTGSACSRIQISGLLITPWTLKIPKVKHQQAWGRWPAPADTAGLGDPRSPPVSPPVLHKEPSLLRCLLFSK